MKTVPRDLFNMGDQVESNLPQSYENEPSEHLMGPSIPKDNGEVLLTRTDVPETIIDVPSEEFVTQQLEVEEEEFEDESADEFEDESENEYEDEFEDELEDESEEEFEYDTP
uniref:Pectate lyase n=1 Tax=Solanum tuberosum TaxID=4113 RepID=M1E132_SOLTU